MLSSVWDSGGIKCLFCARIRRQIQDGRPVEEVMSSTPVASHYKRPSDEVVFLDNSPSKRGLLCYGVLWYVLAAEPNGSAETVASGGVVDEDDSSNTSGRRAIEKFERR